MLGNGFTGIALGGAPEALAFYVARNDFWRLKSALDESYPAVLGKIELSVPELKGTSYLVEQDLYDAISYASFTKESLSVYCKTYLAATEDIWVLEIRMEGKDALEGSARIVLPGEKEILNEPPLERVFPDIRENDFTSDGIQYVSRAFVDSVDIPTKAAMALHVEGSPDGKFILRPGETVRIVGSFSSNFKSDDCVAEVIRKVADCSVRENWWL